MRTILVSFHCNRRAGHNRTVALLPLHLGCISRSSAAAAVVLFRHSTLGDANGANGSLA
jgi:hypothetical protein